VLEGADIIVLAIPSQFVPEFLRDFPQAFCHLPFISTTKGILDPAVFAMFHNYSALSGPGFAEEINQNKPTILTSTTPLAHDLLATDWLTIELTDDVRGVMACGALKNVYSIGAGIQNLHIDTLEFDAYIRVALLELKTAIQILGGNPATADLACGVGDLTLTCGSPLSRNFQFGLSFAKSPDHLPAATTEGLSTLLTLPPELKELPLINAILKKIEQ
jgi:glycerol-3-phosphate dehydrogenase (NAD(P)+)